MTTFFVRCWFLTLALLTAPAVGASDPVSEWNQRADTCASEAKQNALFATRTLAMVHTAMFDAMNSIEGRYTPYKFKVAAVPGSSVESAGVAAAHAVLEKLFPDQKASLDAAFVASLSRIPNGSGKTAGITVGEEVAARILALRVHDGADAADVYRPSTAPGVYVPTTLPIGAQWGDVTPWVMEQGSQFRPSPPPQLTSPEWAHDYNEVKDLGGTKSTLRTREQTDIARFWIITGPEISDPIIRQLASSPGRSLLQNARLFALVEMAAADAYVAVFDAKYTFNFWRPITAIRNGDVDGNPATSRDPTWEPVIETPLHPEYPCAHCITSAAARTVLEAEFGTGPHALSMTSPTAPGVERKWTSIREFAEEVSAARIYGGIHYRNSIEVAKAMGAKIGDLTVQN